MYDLAIIGGGPAGYVAAENAAAKGMKVILFEKREGLYSHKNPSLQCKDV